MPVSSWTVAGAVALLCAFLGHKYLGEPNRSPYPLPPGPPGLPIVGNVRGINTDAPWLTYTEWAKKYGDLVYSRLFNQVIIIVNSEKVARDLFEARANIYSNRPYVAGNDIMGTNFNTVFKPYGNEWRLHRKLFHQTFKSDSIPSEKPVCQKMVKDCVDLPFEHALRRKDNGSTAPAMVLDALWKENAQHASVEWMQMLKDASGTVFGAASETTGTTLLTFILAMILHPEVQEKAQAQIDAVIGNDRLPSLEDRTSLPYIDAIFREILRWHPTAPLALPHATAESDVYQGYYIPKGAVIMSNVWAMAQNEEKYPRPLEFIPERFLDKEGNLKEDDLVGIAYGFGRRICPGRHFANASVWIAMASILAVFKMGKAKDSEGHDIPLNVTWSKGLASHPLPFPCSISPRFQGLDADVLERMVSIGA